MNEFEKQVFNSLSEEEQEKIAGGGDINPDDDLTKKQCDELRNAAKTTRPKVVRDLAPLNSPTVQLLYGLPRPKGPNWPIKPQKPLQPLNPVTQEETQQSTTDSNATDKS